MRNGNVYEHNEEPQCRIQKCYVPFLFRYILYIDTKEGKLEEVKGIINVSRDTHDSFEKSNVLKLIKYVIVKIVLALARVTPP